MADHLLAFSASLGAATTYQQLLAVADQLYTRQNNEYQMPQDWYADWIAAIGTNLLACRIFTASLRLRGNPQAFPFNLAAVNTAFPSYCDMTDEPLHGVAEENLRMEALHTAVGPDQVTSFASVSQTKQNNNKNYMQGRWIRGSASVTTLANAWSSLGAITFDDVLEGGSYAVYGMIGEEPSHFASRLVFQNQYERPGSLALAALGNNMMLADLVRRLGLWGVFDTYSLPQLEGYATAGATVTVNVWLNVAKSDGFQPPFRGTTGY